MEFFIYNKNNKSKTTSTAIALKTVWLDNTDLPHKQKVMQDYKRIDTGQRNKRNWHQESAHLAVDGIINTEDTVNE